MRYILDGAYTLCGWDKLPFAIMDKNSGESYFFNKEQYVFLLKLNGKNDIDPEALGANKSLFDEMLRNHVIHEAAAGEVRTLYYKEYKGMYKSNAQWSITGKCNYHCRHCFQSAPDGILGEPTLAQCFDIIQQLDRCGIKTVSITGGEPLIRNDFFEIVDELIHHGIHISTLYTNGKLVTREFLDELKKRQLHPTFQISFDGVGCHDWMRGVAGAEQTALDAFRLLKDKGFFGGSAMCLCRENVGTIRKTVKTLASVGCDFLKLQCAMPQGEWMDQSEHYLTTAETLQAYLDYLPQYKEDGCPLSIQMEGFFLYEKAGDFYRVVCDRNIREDELGTVYPCGVIHHSLYIGPNGAVTPCMSMCGAEIEKQFPNLFETPLEEILSRSSYTELTGKKADYVLDRNEKCRECKYRARCCGGCRAMGTGSSGNDYFAIDPVSCEMFTGGWVDRLYALAGNLFAHNKQDQDREDC